MYSVVLSCVCLVLTMHKLHYYSTTSICCGSVGQLFRGFFFSGHDLDSLWICCTLSIVVICRAATNRSEWSLCVNEHDADASVAAAH